MTLEHEQELPIASNPAAKILNARCIQPMLHKEPLLAVMVDADHDSFGEKMSTFTFQARWKEELVCTGPGGTFVLELPMGRLSAFLPTEDAWQKKAPAWARDLWPVLKVELESWCKESKAELVVDESAHVW